MPGVRSHVLGMPDGSDDNRKLYPNAVCSDADVGVLVGRYAWLGLHRALTPASSSRAGSGTHLRGDRHSTEFDHQVLLRARVTAIRQIWPDMHALFLPGRLRLSSAARLQSGLFAAG